MPIFYHFHIFLATFYIFFGTNISIQCPLPVPVCCMFFVSQKIHINQSPNGIKIYGDLFWNICDFWEEESTQDGARGPHEAPGRACPPGASGLLPKLRGFLLFQKKLIQRFFFPFGLRLILIF